MSRATELAEDMHNLYEVYAKRVGWETQESTRVNFADLPAKNQGVMLAMGEWAEQLESQAYEKAIQRAIELIGEDRPTRGVPSYSNHVTSQNYLRHELRQALEAELDSNSMKIEGIKKESNQ